MPTESNGVSVCVKHNAKLSTTTLVAACIMTAARLRALITLWQPTVCSTVPNKLECQSQTHLGARSCTSDYINQ